MGEEKRRRRRRRRRREEKKEEEMRKEKQMYEMFGTFVWNTWLELFRTNSCLGYEFFQPNSLSICRLGKTLTYKCVIWLFGLVVVLNGRKNCIEKMLGFRGDVVLFFKLMFLFLS